MQADLTEATPKNEIYYTFSRLRKAATVKLHFTIQLTGVKIRK